MDLATKVDSFFGVLHRMMHQGQDRRLETPQVHRYVRLRIEVVRRKVVIGRESLGREVNVSAFDNPLETAISDLTRSTRDWKVCDQGVLELEGDQAACGAASQVLAQLLECPTTVEVVGVRDPEGRHRIDQGFCGQDGVDSSAQLVLEREGDLVVGGPELGNVGPNRWARVVIDHQDDVIETCGYRDGRDEVYDAFAVLDDRRELLQTPVSSRPSSTQDDEGWSTHVLNVITAHSRVNL